jgi:hypothetical protein
MAYACLSVFVSDQKWNPLDGKIVPLVLMHSMMEYSVVLISVVCGFLVQSTTLLEASAADHGYGGVA